MDLEKLELLVTRSVYRQRVGRCKIEISKKPVSLDPRVGEELLSWKQAAPYNQPDDWVFASMRKRGKRPYSPESLLKEVHLSGGSAGEDHQAHRLAHLTAYLHNPAQGQRRGRESDAGAVAARNSKDDA
jgi:hypothetical protein